MRRVDFIHGWHYDSGSGMHLFGFDPFEKDWATLILIRPPFELLRRLNKARYWLLYRLHPKHQYHLVGTGLDPDYYDVDTLMLNACFALLKRYVEEEMGGVEKIEEFNRELREHPEQWYGGNPVPQPYTSPQADQQEEAVALYRWWMIERPTDLKRNDELIHQLYGYPDGLVRLVWREADNAKLKQADFVVVSDKEELKNRLQEEQWALEKKIHDDEQAMLHRLIDIRLSLWT